LGIGRACGVLRIAAFVAHLANRVIGGALGRFNLSIIVFIPLELRDKVNWGKTL